MCQDLMANYRIVPQNEAIMNTTSIAPLYFTFGAPNFSTDAFIAMSI